MLPSEREAFEAVEAINASLNNYVDDGASEVVFVEACYCGLACVVRWLGIPLWSSEDDDRDVDEATDKYEPLEPFLRKRCLELLDNLSKHANALRKE